MLIEFGQLPLTKKQYKAEQKRYKLLLKKGIGLI